ncbi:MAG: M1 family metallopeptidase, partial [Chitinophagaceae bacterium]|nr:M1 family metallopeptidase [Chitinophagaceae bacterium]
MKFFLTTVAILAAFISKAQEDVVVTTSLDTSWKKNYRASATLINDLVHTKLDVKFDYNKSYMYGKAWITLHPHFYETDSLTLDAKGMTINALALVKDGRNIPLKYTYSDTMQLHIGLDKKYKASEKYTIYIDYVSKPNEVKVAGSAAITDAKGLYFINPKGEDKNKPTQIWTQGETESNSVWFPTIDKPNQKSTEEITMTVPEKYVTLSNGKLISQKKNTDGTRTDNWKMDLPHAPYLFFMGVGDYAIVKDSYKGKEVSYYVEHEYEKVARRIFGNTPEMIGFYARILNMEYPWVKYSQITGRDYVSGAMENTTATLHTDALQQNARQLADGNKYEDYVAHELFHHWFGDCVTAESWSNLTVNESFANYSEVLWNEYKYGKDAGDAKNYEDMLSYLRSGSEKKDLVRFYYRDKEDMFDAVSYNKGGRILHMLRHYVGDSAFFKSLNFYLTQNKFGTGEAHKLRLAFEQITGQDMNWFFNQWYFGSGNPVLDISYAY